MNFRLDCFGRTPFNPKKNRHALPGKVLDVNVPAMLFVRPADDKS